MLDEQDTNDTIDGTENVCDFVGRDTESERLIDSMLQSTDLLDGDIKMGFEERDECGDRCNGQASLPQVEDS